VIFPQDQKAEPEYGEDINPISRLIQIQQAKKEREPIYSLLEERGMPRRREFVMEVSMRNMNTVKLLFAEHFVDTDTTTLKFKIIVPIMPYVSM
jgi:dsRNA-specific ribonuclease